jgi:hypothetical protein
MKTIKIIISTLLLYHASLVSGDEWSIGIYTGNTPLDVAPHSQVVNPVLTKDDVTDVDAEFVADPFMIRKDSTWYMFFEVYSNDGDIGYASSVDGINWTYRNIVIDENFQMSYPYVFEWEGSYYIIPETHEANALRLYRASNFPTGWSYVGNLMVGDYHDPSLFRYADKWWLFTTEDAGADNTLHLYYADALLGPWHEHPLSPVIRNDPDIARPGGRVTQFNGRLFRYTQDCYPTYGNKVRAFEITELSTTRYQEVEVAGNPILDADGLGWNANGMHNIDPHLLPDGTWLAVVDGIGDPDQLDFYGLWLSNSADRSNARLFDHNEPPSADAGADQVVAEGVSVQLSGSGTDPNGDTLSYQWTQTAGIPVTLSSDLVANPFFTAPSGLPADEVLTFELVTRDGEFSSVPRLRKHHGTASSMGAS